MRQFQVPQFITVEDRVVGPLTVKQSLFLGLGVVLIVLYNYVFSRAITALLAIPTAILCIALAFVKVNQRPFSAIFQSMVFYFLRPRVYIWKHNIPTKQKLDESVKPDQTVKSIPKLSESKLSDLAWSLDIKEKELGQREHFDINERRK